MRRVPVTKIRKGMLIRAGEPERTFYTLGNWRKTLDEPAASAAWSGKTIHVVLLRGDYAGRTTHMWIKPGTENKKVEVLWEVPRGQK